MKQADNFNPGKWLVENKLTNQSQLNEMPKIASPGPKIVSYFTHYGGSGLFQTEKGIEIMKQILDDFNQTHPNNSNTYANVDFENGDDEIAIINHPLYDSYVKEGERAFRFLKPIIIKYYNGKPNTNGVSFGDDGFVIDSEIYIGPEITNNDDQGFDDLEEYLLDQSILEPTSPVILSLADRIFMTFVND